MKKILIPGICICVLGLVLVLFDPVCQWINARYHSVVIGTYAGDVDGLDSAALAAELDRAEEHNAMLRDVSAVTNPFVEQGAVDNRDYDTLLNFSDGVMAYVEIPAIDVLLPVYHGVSNSVLQKGLGHIPETSLPIGGADTHAVIVGHSGMTTARLLTDLPDLVVGDEFYIHVATQTMTYTVDKIQEVVPSDTSELTIQPGEDYVTLVTCVPVGVNTYRLLVRGTRTG